MWLDILRVVRSVAGLVCALLLAAGCTGQEEAAEVRRTSTEETANPQASESYPQRRYLLAEGALRERPDSSAAPFAPLETGSVIMVGRARQNGWRLVYAPGADGEMGWVRQAKVSASAPDPLHLMSAELNRASDGWGVESVTGQIQNTSSRTYSYVQVEITLKDATGTVVGSTMDNVRHLGPSESWAFEAPVTEGGVSTYEIERISGR